MSAPSINPVFVSDLDTLRSKLRLSGAKQTDALSIINEAIEEVRIGIYDALGVSRVAELQAITYAENPDTADEILRAKANLLESLWCRMILLTRLPQMALDASASLRQAWNEEGLGRDKSGKEITDEIERLQSKIDELIAALLGAVVERSTLNVSTIGPDGVQLIPGQSMMQGGCL